MRGAITTSITVATIAILYRYWLVAPVLRYLNLSGWRLVAIAAAAAIGCALSRLRFSALALVCASMAGLLLGGTWAAWQAPNDVPVSIIAAFTAYLESFWREVIVLTAASTIAGSCFARIAKNQSQH